jgi:transglutaminase-like putative cysteine protease/tetratricopeptide (TPR) repeat protein
VKLRFVALALGFFASPMSARGETGMFHPDLERRVADVEAARGPEAYAAIRRLWSAWDRARPSHVEEALLSASGNAKLDPPVRAYAATLGALARVRRGDLKSAATEIARLGYVDRWLVIGPFDNEGKAGLDTAFGPELSFDKPIVFGRAESGKERPVRWRAVPREFPHGFVSMGSLMRPEQKVCGYATTFVRDKASKRPRTVTAWIGSGGAFKAFWNGREVLTSDRYAAHDFDRYAVSLRLDPGTNAFTLKLCGEDAPPVFSVRFGDERGAPAAELELSNDPAVSVAATELVERLKKEQASPKPVKPSVEGPAQAFERLTAGKNASARELEAHARYLYETDGDDPALHLARDLAVRAAEKEPTVRRRLLAAALAEDHNQRRDWITRAETLVPRGKYDKDVLLARALERRESPSFQEAFPYFDRLLAIDPDNVLALQGRVELYNMAGLPRTALATLESALNRNPESVNLLNLHASQLRALGRSSEASEVEARYSGLRFDDGTFLGQMIALSVARRDQKAAEHWAERLIGSHPGDLWALNTAARAFRSLGQSDRAAATYQRSLELAPEDAGTLRALADLYGEIGKPDAQLAQLREILRIRPQDKSVREYVNHVEPKRARADESYAWAPERFLPLRHEPARGENRRTLRDLTVSTVFENGLSSKYRQLVFQPLTDSAAAAARQHGFAYEADQQVVELRGAKVYRANGRIDEAIESGEGPADDPSIAMYTSARVFYVQFPRLEAGDVVELRYRIDDVTRRNEFNDYFGEITSLQSGDPTANAEYVVVTPKSRQLYFDHQVPGLRVSTTEQQDQRIYRFFAPKVAALDPEPAMPPVQELLQAVHVSTYKTWDDLGRWYYGLIKDQFDLDDETRKLAKQITAGKKTEREKVEAVYDWVIRNTRYVALEFGIYGYKPRRCVQTVARGWGDCKDKATVIVTLLKELGIPATMVVLRTQFKGGLRSKIPSFAPFDHAIAYVPSLDLYLDGTAEHTGIEELPRADIGALGLRVNDGKPDLVTVPIPPADKNFVEREVRAKIQKNGDSKLELDYRAAGYTAATWRRQYHAESVRRERLSHDLGGELPGFVITPGAQGVQTSNLDDPREPVKLHVEGSAPSFARREGSQLSMAVTNPFRLTSTYATLSQRKQDVWTLAFTELRDTFVIDLPPGARVVSSPENKQGTSEFGSYSVVVEQQGDRIRVKSRVGLTVPRVKPADYPAFKRFCEAADAALSPRLVIQP